MIGISLLRGGVSSTQWYTSNCLSKILIDISSATIVQKCQSGLFHYAFNRLFFELVAARFYAFVEAAKKASH